MMILKTLLIMALLLNAADALSQTVSGNLSVTVTPPGGAAVNPPTQAVAAGYTTLATNQDFTGTTGIDIACDLANQNAPGHYWYTWFQGLLYQPNGCAGITWPATDPATGTGALRISWTSANPGFQQGRVGLASSNNDGSSEHTFPIKMYMEAWVRFANNGYLGPWYNNWAWWSKKVSGGLELDVYEEHGATTSATRAANQWLGVAGALNWGNGFAQNTSGLFGPYTFDGNIYHKWGALYTVQNNPTVCVFSPSTPVANGTTPCLEACGYIDDVFIGCGVTPLVGDEINQRSVLLMDATVSCDNRGGGGYGTEGLSSCMDMPVSGVGSNGAGGTRVTIGRSIQGQYGGVASSAPVKIAGTNTSADGIHTWSLLSDTQFDLPSVPFSGTWSGTGIVNPSPIEMYVKSYRVWSCAAWQTTNC
jgi:hypothetical protein